MRVSRSARGTIDGEAIAVGVRPVLNGYALTHRGVAVDACVLTRREAELAALMPEVTLDARRAALISPMPGLLKAIHVAAGETVKGRAGSLRDRGNEDGDRASC